MRVVLCYCTNCGKQYRWLASGFSYDDYKYGTQTHCYDCNEIIKHFNSLMKDELDKIEKTSVILDIETKEVTLNQLLEWEKLDEQEYKEKYCKEPFYFPMMKVCYPGLSRLIKKDKWEHDKRGKVIGRGEFNKRQYFYTYWPSEKEKAKIFVKVRQNVKTKSILEYIKSK